MERESGLRMEAQEIQGVGKKEESVIETGPDRDVGKDVGKYWVMEYKEEKLFQEEYSQITEVKGLHSMNPEEDAQL